MKAQSLEVSKSIFEDSKKPFSSKRKVHDSMHPSFPDIDKEELKGPVRKNGG